MKSNKIKRIALAAALASTVFAGTAEIGFAQTTSDVLTTVASQVRSNDFAAGRSTINQLQQSGIGSITVGNESVSLSEIEAMIAAAEAGQMSAAELAAYLEALAASAARALFVPAQPPVDTSDGVSDNVFPTGSEG